MAITYGNQNKLFRFYEMNNQGLKNEINNLNYQDLLS